MNSTRARAANSAASVHVHGRASLVAASFGLVLLAGEATALRGAVVQERTVLVGATLIDGRGGAPVANSRVIIEHGRFVCVSGATGCPSAPADREVMVSGLWLTPGLIDTHVHLNPNRPEEFEKAQALRFALGTTAVRDAGSQRLDKMVMERARAAEPGQAVPRIVISERPVVKYAEQFGVAMGGALVEQLAEAGVDAIKIKDNISEDSVWRSELRAAVSLGLPAWGHTWYGAPARGMTREAIAAGLSGVSHLTAFAVEARSEPLDYDPPDDREGEAWAWYAGLWLTVDEARLDTLIGLMLERNVWLEPTLGGEYYRLMDLHPPPHLDFLRAWPPSLRELLSGRSLLEQPAGPRHPEPQARMNAFVRRFHERGGVLITGSDHLRPGLGLHAELRMLREAGLSPVDAILAATSAAAKALNAEDLGVIAPGKVADAVVYYADPLGAPDNTMKIRHVIKGGVLHDSEALLEPFRASYRSLQMATWRGRARRFLPLIAVMLVSGGLGCWCLFRWQPRTAQRA